MNTGLLLDSLILYHYPTVALLRNRAFLAYLKESFHLFDQRPYNLQHIIHKRNAYNAVHLLKICWQSYWEIINLIQNLVRLLWKLTHSFQISKTLKVLGWNSVDLNGITKLYLLRSLNIHFWSIVVWSTTYSSIPASHVCSVEQTLTKYYYM